MLQRAVAAFIVGAVGRITKLIPGLIGLPVAQAVLAAVSLLALVRPGSLRGNGCSREVLPRGVRWFPGFAVFSVLFSIYKSCSLESVLTGIPRILVRPAS